MTMPSRRLSTSGPALAESPEDATRAAEQQERGGWPAEEERDGVGEQGLIQPKLPLRCRCHGVVYPRGEGAGEKNSEEE
jgi:hypothetical protein